MDGSVARALGKRLSLLIIIFLAAAATVFILWPGYFFTFDFSIGPNYPRVLMAELSGHGSNLASSGPSPTADAFYGWTVSLLAHIMPVWLVQKLVLLSFAAFSGIGMYRLLPRNLGMFRYLAALLYMVNPFVLDRMAAGHAYVLWGYAVLPWAVESFVRLADSPGLRTATVSGIWMTLVAPSEHLLPMAWGFLLLFCLLGLTLPRSRLRLAGAFLAANVVFLALNWPWFVSFLNGQAGVVRAVNDISVDQLQVFATDKGPNVFLNVAGLHGFWSGVRQLHGPWMISMAIVLPCLAAYGFILAVKKRWLKGIGLGLAVPVAIVMAVGVSSAVTAPVFNFFYQNVPLFHGYREPQKFVSLLALAYAYAITLASADLFQRAKFNVSRHTGRVVFGAMLALPVIYTGLALPGIGNRVKVADYPVDYYEVRSYMQEGMEDANVLYLPWHQYISFEWLGLKIGNPAGLFFPGGAIRGDNLELGEIKRESGNPVSRYVEAILAQRKGMSDMGALLSPLNVRYVVLLKEGDFADYGFLSDQNDLRPVMETPRIVVYENTMAGGGLNPDNITSAAAGLTSWTAADSSELQLALGKWLQKRNYLPEYLLASTLFIACLVAVALTRGRTKPSLRTTPRFEHSRRLTDQIVNDDKP